MRYKTCSWLCVMVICGLGSSWAMGQAATGSAGRPPEADKPTTVTLVLRPAAPPRAALEYQLLPALLDRKPGNAAVQYNKIALLLAEQNRQERIQKVSDWLELPLERLPRNEVKGVLREFRSVLDELDLAARRERCDWELPLRERSFFAILLPELGKLREFARLIALKARFEMAEGRCDDALRTLQTGYALARHAGSGPTLINSLVGIAVAQMMSARVQELIQQPHSPNLYWALTTLPQPLVDLRPGIEAEMQGAYMAIPGLREIDWQRRDLAYWQRWMEQVETTMTQGYEVAAPRLGFRPALTALALKGYPQARQALIDQGQSPEEVDAMPVPAVVVRYTVQTYDELRDRMFKWFFVPYWEAQAGLAEAEQYLAKEGRRREIFPVASMLLPAVTRAYETSARCDRTIAALRTVEAIRAYAASHHGNLPERLANVRDMPLPLDPITGGAFRYSRSGDTALLESPAPPGRPAKDYALRWEIRLEKK